MSSLPRALIAFEAECGRINAPVCEALYPPAGPAELADLEAALGRSLPEEVRELFQWHNGIEIVRGAVADFFGPRVWSLLSTTEAADRYRRMRGAALSIDLDDFWPESFMPIFEFRLDNYFLVVDGESGGLRETSREDLPSSEVLPSVESLIALWTDCIRSGRWQLEDGRWTLHPSRLDLPSALCSLA